MNDDVKAVREAIKDGLTPLDFALSRILDGFEAMEKALEWITSVNACDYEYVKVARDVLNKIRGEK